MIFLFSLTLDTSYKIPRVDNDVGLPNSFTTESIALFEYASRRTRRKPLKISVR